MTSVLEWCEQTKQKMNMFEMKSSAFLYGLENSTYFVFCMSYYFLCVSEPASRKNVVVIFFTPKKHISFGFYTL